MVESRVCSRGRRTSGLRLAHCENLQTMWLGLLLRQQSHPLGCPPEDWYGRVLVPIHSFESISEDALANIRLDFAYLIVQWFVYAQSIAALASRSSSTPSPRVALFASPSSARIIANAIRAPTHRFTHCDCPGVSEDEPPKITITYAPSAVDDFIAFADEIENLYPEIVVEGGSSFMSLSQTHPELVKAALSTPPNRRIHLPHQPPPPLRTPDPIQLPSPLHSDEGGSEDISVHAEDGSIFFQSAVNGLDRAALLDAVKAHMSQRGACAV